MASAGPAAALGAAAEPSRAVAELPGSGEHSAILPRSWRYWPAWRTESVRYKLPGMRLLRANKTTTLLICSVAGMKLLAADRGTPAQAKAMLAKAVAHYQTVGRKQAMADFNAKKAPFFDRDLYVVCFDAKGVILANGGFPQYVGFSADLLKDAHGNSVGRKGLEIAQKNGQGAVEYEWINPMTHKVEPKVTYFAKAGDDVCGVGAYNPK